MSELLSYGGGVNSTALVVLLVNEGWHGPIVFADTGCEWPETYCFIDCFEREWLRPRGLEITRLGGGYRAQGSGRDARTLVDFCEDYRVTPFAGTRWCTQGWKSDSVNSWAASNGIAEQIIGIAADEAHRQKGRLCPLVSRGITRQGCIDIIEGAGLEVPQKSGCYICPFQRVAQWRELWKRHPDLFERAARLEDLSSERRGEQAYLRAARDYTLRQLQIGLESQMSLLDDSQWDDLLLYKPCTCGL